MVRLRLEKFQKCHRPEEEVDTPNSSIEIVTTGWADIWLAIMGNYTISVSKPFQHFYCTKSRKLRSDEFNAPYALFMMIVPHVKDLLIFPYFFENKLSSLRFVSCGEAKLSLAVFHELISVFDTWILLFTGVSMIAVITPLLSLSEIKTGILDHWLSPLKVLLEQGNPFADGVINRERLRWATGLFLLAGIVLSNAYKNANVYNMITPRKPVPYEYIKQLRENNFAIYTRIATVIRGSESEK